PGLDPPGVLPVVEDARVGAGSDDRGVRVARRAVAPEDELERRLHLVLVESRPRIAHRLGVGVAADLARAPLARELGGRAPEAHLVQDGPGVLEADRRRIAASAGPTQLDDQARDAPVERALTEAGVDPWPVHQGLGALLDRPVARM